MSQATIEERDGLNVKMFNAALIKLLRIKDEDTINWITDQKQLWRRYIGIYLLSCRLFPDGLDKDLETLVKEWDGNIYAKAYTMAIANDIAMGYVYLVYLSQQKPEFVEFLRNHHKRKKKMEEATFPTIRAYQVFKDCYSDNLFMEYVVSNVGTINKLGTTILQTMYANHLLNKNHTAKESKAMYHEKVAKTCLELVLAFQQRETGRKERLKTALDTFLSMVRYAGVATLQTGINDLDIINKEMKQVQKNAGTQTPDPVTEMLEKLQEEIRLYNQRNKQLNRKINKRKKAKITIKVIEAE